MNNKLIHSLGLVALLFANAPALADSDGRHHDGDHEYWRHHDDQGDNGRYHRHRRGDGDGDIAPIATDDTGNDTAGGSPDGDAN